MNTTNGDDGTKRSIRSLRELSQDVRPARDLWPGISAEISKDASRAQNSSGRGASSGPSRLQWIALAAVVAALAVGMWIGRTLFPAVAPQPTLQLASSASANGGGTNAGSANVLDAAFVRDPRYQKQRAELIHALEEKLKTLPPPTQRKVTASLETIRKSIADIQAELGKDPANALLQELLVNSYQDEMRVLTAVQEAGNSGQEI